MTQHIDAALLSDARILAAYLIFFGSYFVFALGKFPWMKIDRPGAAIIGAVLMVAFRIVGADEALQSIDFATIVLLFAMMVVVANLRLGGFFERLAESIVQRLHPHHLLPTVILLCGVLSAFLVNDIVCLVMTPFVLHMARRLGMPPVPYLLAVATSLEHRQRRDDHRQPAEHADRVAVRDLVSRLHRPPRADRRRRPVSELGADLLALPARRWRSRGGGGRAVGARVPACAPMRKKPVVVLVIVLAGFLAGVPPAMMAAIGAALLLITRTVEPRKVYRRSTGACWSSSSGLFIIVAGAHRAGLTATLLEPAAALGSSSHRDLRAGHRRPVEPRQQRSRGDAAAHAGVELPGPARRAG